LTGGWESRGQWAGTSGKWFDRADRFHRAGLGRDTRAQRQDRADLAKRYRDGHQHCPAEPYDRYGEPGRHDQAIGVAIRACRAGHRVLFATAPE